MLLFLFSAKETIEDPLTNGKKCNATDNIVTKPFNGFSKKKPWIFWSAILSQLTLLTGLIGGTGKRLWGRVLIYVDVSGDIGPTVLC